MCPMIERGHRLERRRRDGRRGRGLVGLGLIAPFLGGKGEFIVPLLAEAADEGLLEELIDGEVELLA